MSKLKNKFKLPKFKKDKEERGEEIESEVVVLEAYPPEGISEEPAKPKATKKPKKGIKSVFTKLHSMIWGSDPPGKYNTEGTPYPPYCWRARIRRWYYAKYKGWVYYITTIYDRPHDEYLYDMEFIPKKDLPREAVHVTNEKNTWHLDLDHPNKDFITYDSDYGFTAHDACLYIKCNKIDEAMKIDLDAKPSADTKKLIGIIVGVVIAFIIFYMIYMQR